MKRIVLAGAAALIATIAPFAAAHAQVAVSVSTPEFGIRIGAPAPRAFYPPPYAVYPAPVYVPTPVYLPPVYAPPPRYAAPPVIVRTVVVPAVGYRHYPRYAGARVAQGHFKHGRHRHRGPHRSYR